MKIMRFLSEHRVCNVNVKDYIKDAVQYSLKSQSSTANGASISSAFSDEGKWSKITPLKK